MRYIYVACFTTVALAPSRVGAQAGSVRTTPPRDTSQSPALSDSMAARLRGWGVLPGTLPSFSRVIAGDSVRANPACPMRVLRPDSSRHLAEIRADVLRSGDRMPMQETTCSNPLDKRR